MNLSQFNPDLDVRTISDGDVVGLDGDLVVHFSSNDDTVYNSGLTLQDWLDGHVEAWVMTEEEAERVGIEDYAAYQDRVRQMNPSLFGPSPAAR